jgi:hypothetical protein
MEKGSAVPRWQHRYKLCSIGLLAEWNSWFMLCCTQIKGRNGVPSITSYFQSLGQNWPSFNELEYDTWFWLWTTIRRTSHSQGGISRCNSLVYRHTRALDPTEALRLQTHFPGDDRNGIQAYSTVQFEQLGRILTQRIFRDRQYRHALAKDLGSLVIAECWGENVG